MSDRFNLHEKIPISRVRPPLSKLGPAPIVTPTEDRLDILQVAHDSAMLRTWVGQFMTKKISNEMAGIPMPPMIFESMSGRKRVDAGYNVFRDEDMTGMEPYFDELKNVFSPQEFQSFKFALSINADLRHNVEDYPVIDFFGAALIDPINLIPVPFVLGKGAWRAAKQAMAINAPLVATTEALRVSLDPDAHPIEIFYSTMGSMLFAGLIGGLAGKYTKPIGKTTVSDALKILIPLDKPIPASEAGMFNWVRYLGTGAFRRIHDRLRATDSDGVPKSEQWVDRVSVKRVESPDGQDVISMRFDDEEIGFGILHRGGDTIRISSIVVPKAMRGKGIATAAYKAVIKFAQENGLKVSSDTSTTPAAAGVWKNLKDEGFNIETNKTSEIESRTSGQDTLRPGDGEPNFKVLPVLEDQKAKIPESLKRNWDEFTAELKSAGVRVSAAVKELNKAKKALKAVKNNKGGWKTKKQEIVDEAEAVLLQAKSDQRIWKSNVD